ncbi:MAG: NAD-dependent epimerase [Bacteroidota bacterium]
MNYTDKPILITGSAGFIGFHLSRKLMDSGLKVVGVDSLNDYYDVTLKKDRLDILKSYEGFSFEELNISDKPRLTEVFEKYEVEYVVNLAAQAGVRYSLTHPEAYIDSNVNGFLNILECSRHNNIKHLVYASSSSVYGANKKMPFSVKDNIDHPVSLYAATKKSNELFAHSYAANFGLPSSGLRFFTVYGPWGRPDMALFLFTKAILEGRAIDVYNFGKMRRDFTYVDDVVEGISRLIPTVPTKNEEWDAMNPDPSSSFAPYKVYNIGNSNPVELMDYIKEIERNLGKEAKKNLMPIQTGDVPETFADVEALMQAVGYKPKTTIEEGIQKFIDWYKEYYKV